MLSVTRRGEVGGSEDRLGNLPNDILIRILSFLSTKEVIRTKILAKRWMSLWASVPTLDLRVENLHSESEVSDKEGNVLYFLDNILTGHSMPYLKKLAVSFTFHDNSLLFTCISSAMERNVPYLQLEIECCECVNTEWPQTLFSCKSLVVLKLCNTHYNFGLVLNFPHSSTCFPNLKVLELKKIRYKDDDSARNLVSSCPVLEDLVLVKDASDDMRILNITSRSLKNLLLEIYRLHKLVIDAPALEVIDIEHGNALIYETRNLSSLIKAKVHNFDWYDNCLSDHYGMISNVKLLSLVSTGGYFPGIRHGNITSLSKFLNLKCLELCDDSSGHKLNWKYLMETLNRMIVLEVLIFGASLVSHDDEPEASEMKVPSCLVSHLKTIKIAKFEWGWRETKKLRFFLANSHVLEKMVVKFLYQGEAHEHGEELLLYWRASKACHVEILSSSNL